MRLKPAIIACSLLANLVLAGFLVAAIVREPAPVAPKRPPKRDRAFRAPPRIPVDPQTWRELDDLTVPELVRRLREQHFPEAAIRAIVRARAREKYADRLHALALVIREQPFWTNPLRSVSRAERDLFRTIDREVRDAMGGDGDDSSSLTLARAMGPLPLDKLRKLEQINEDYRDITDDVRTAANGVLLPADLDQLALLEREKRADIEKLLTPEELEQYDLRTGRTADRLRWSLADFKPTEDEYLKLYRLRKAFDDQFPRPPSTPEQRAAYAAAEKDLSQRVAETLGTSRYDDYLRATDSTWRTNDRFARQNQIAPEVVPQLVAVEHEYAQRLHELDAANLGVDAQKAGLAALNAEATARLAPLLGASLNAYRRNSWWYGRLVQPPTDLGGFR